MNEGQNSISDERSVLVNCADSELAIHMIITRVAMVDELRCTTLGIPFTWGRVTRVV